MIEPPRIAESGGAGDFEIRQRFGGTGGLKGRSAIGGRGFSLAAPITHAVKWPQEPIHGPGDGTGVGFPSWSAESKLAGLAGQPGWHAPDLVSSLTKRQGPGVNPVSTQCG